MIVSSLQHKSLREPQRPSIRCLRHSKARSIMEDKIILINKPVDWTSFDVVKYIRNALGKAKTGHAGTLDPLASGLLVLCTGKFTKLIPQIQDAEKEYTGTLVLGAITPSYDLETQIIDEKDYSFVTEHLVRDTALKFTGEIMQSPPPHSAVKIGGRRAYDLARKGHDVIITPKTVVIKEFEITSISLPEVKFRIVCSKGTYIRSLAHDFGQSLGCGAYLSALCRTRIGEYKLENAIEPSNFNKRSLLPSD